MKWRVAWAILLALNMPMARRIVVRDMGNGVDRVEAQEIIVGDDASKHCEHPECVRLHRPLPKRMDDLLSDLGLSAERVCACARQIDEKTVEIVAVWA